MQKQTGKKKLLILALTAVILVAAAVILWLVFSQKKEDPGRQAAGLVVSDEAEEWNKELEDTSGGQQGIKIPGYGEITVASGGDSLEYHPFEPGRQQLLFSVAITIDESETPIYESDLIEPGKALQNFRYQNPWSGRIRDSSEYLRLHHG